MENVEQVDLLNTEMPDVAQEIKKNETSKQNDTRPSMATTPHCSQRFLHLGTTGVLQLRDLYPL